MISQFYLLTKKKFLPLFVTQFLGAFNDNVFKNAMVILITYRAASSAGLNPQIVVTAAAGIFILPFFLFSAVAGQLADKYEKSFLIRRIKFTEIIIMLVGSAAFYLEDVYLLMFVLFLMGSQSAFFGPLKYGILPDHLKKNELIGGNALVSASTFIAILLGTIIGGLLIMYINGLAIISFIVVSCALCGWAASGYIPATRNNRVTYFINKNFLSETINVLRLLLKNKKSFHSAIAISWFWFIGATFLAQFPNYGHRILGGSEEVVILFLAAFSVGIGLGALLCNLMLGGKINLRFTPHALFLMSVFICDLVYVSSNYNLPEVETENLISAAEFFNIAGNIRIFADLLMIAVCGGVYIVPLYATLQTSAKSTQRSRVIAANNIMNALFMVISAIFTVIMLSVNYMVTEVFLSVAIMNFLILFLIRCRIF